MNTLQQFLLLILVVFSQLNLWADDGDSLAVEPLRPVNAAYMAEIGGSGMTDTYLSPLKYSGISFAFNYERLQAMKFNPDRWIMHLSVGGEIDKNDNPARNATMWYWGINASWGMLYKWNVLPQLSVMAGGSTSLDLGCLYNARNGNNPASAKAAWTVNATAMAVWNTNIGRLPVTVRYQPTLPFVGAFFSPDYAELYYEIYLGNHGGLAHCAWWGNYFAMDNLVTIDLHLSNTSLRIGYHGKILSTKVNDITTRMITNNFILGVAGEWISISPSKTINPQARIISSIY